MKFDSTERTVLLCGAVFIAFACVIFAVKDDPDVSNALGAGMLGIFLLTLGAIIYFAPTIVGRKKRKQRVHFLSQ